ncbi:MAG: iron ABC transporter permease [Lentisphaeria bacterium]|nr:MAG: iron ABC transporter permease [Lentisphaeria bacterium]
MLHLARCFFSRGGSGREALRGRIFCASFPAARYPIPPGRFCWNSGCPGCSPPCWRAECWGRPEAQLRIFSATTLLPRMCWEWSMPRRWGAVFGLFLPAIGLTAPAMVTAALSLGLLFLTGGRRNWDGATLILAGIAVNAFTSALTSGALYLADERLSSLVFWLLGGFWRITWGDVVLLATVALSSWGVLFRLAPELDLLLLGDRSAELSGVRMRRLKPLLMLTVATLSATVVSCCGVIGFVGLAVPHMVRMLCGGTFRRLLPGCILGGGLLLLLADLLARTVAAPHEIPVGILTALAGGPFFFIFCCAGGRIVIELKNVSFAYSRGIPF